MLFGGRVLRWYCILLGVGEMFVRDAVGTVVFRLVEARRGECCCVWYCWQVNLDFGVFAFFTFNKEKAAKARNNAMADTQP